MRIRIEMERDDVTMIRAKLSDFGGSVEKWKDAFYEICRYQMTWDFAYDIKLWSTRSGDVVLVMYVKHAYLDHVTELMQDLGYGVLEKTDAKVGLVDRYSGNVDAEADLLILE